MIKLKTPKEINQIKIACNALVEWMEQCIANLQMGGYWRGTDIELELLQYVDHLNRLYNRKRSQHNDAFDTPFSWQKNIDGDSFGSPVCISINDEIVHSRPTEEKFKTGDIITIDVGLSYHGWCADMARTVIYNTGPDMDSANKSHYTLIKSCQSALYQAYEQCKPGNTIKDISTAIGIEAGEHKLGVVIDYMGHGIGKDLHEPPRICNLPSLFPEQDSIVLRPGMVFCLEPMFTLGNGRTTLSPDGWKIWTQDGSMAAHFESQILVTEEGCEVLTKLAGEYPQEE
jgi:methionyl aminopeptidase